MGYPRAQSPSWVLGKAGAVLRLKWPKSLCSSWYSNHITYSSYKGFLGLEHEVFGCKKSETGPSDRLPVLLLTHHFPTDRISCWRDYSLIPRQAYKSGINSLGANSQRCHTLSVIWLKPQEQSYESSMTIPYVERRKLRLREVTELPKSISW